MRLTIRGDRERETHGKRVPCQYYGTMNDTVSALPVGQVTSTNERGRRRNESPTNAKG